MQTTNLKQEVLKSIAQLADDADLDEIIYQLYLVDKLCKSRAAIAQGQLISHQDLKLEIEQW